MRRLLMGVFGVFWAALVFVLTLWLTFPSDAFVQRIRAEAPGVLGAEYSLDLVSASPWWVGVSTHDLKLYHTPRRPRSGEEGGPTLVAVADDVRIRAGLFSLLARAPYVTGAVTLTEGTLDYAVGTRMEGGTMQVESLQIDASSFPLADLMMFLPEGAEFDAVGTVDLSVDLQGGEDGMKSANGDISLTGKGIVLSNVVIPDIGPLGFDVPIDSLELSFDVDEGTAAVDIGRIMSELGTVEIEGDLTLRDPLDRTSINLEIIVSDLGEKLQAFSMMMSSAKHADSKYHYQCRGIVSRLSSCPTPMRERSVSRPTTRPTVRPTAAAPRVPSDAGEFQKTESDDERAKRREEIRERLRLRREERETDGGRVLEPDEGDEFEDDPEEFDEEDFDDEDFEDDDFEDFED